MRIVRNGFGFGRRRGGCRIGLVVVVGKHGCWPPEDYFALGSRYAAPCSVEKVPCCFPVGVNARRLTAERLLGTQMLRASKTLQPCKDTRRLNPLSMKPRSGPRRARRAFFRGENPARRPLRCGTSRTISSACGCRCAARAHLHASVESICRLEVAPLRPL